MVWFVLGVISVRLFGFTPGQLALGLRVASVDNRMHVGIGRAIVRGMLVFFVVPALFTDSDRRGYQDRLTAPPSCAADVEREVVLEMLSGYRTQAHVRSDIRAGRLQCGAGARDDHRPPVSQHV